MFSRRIVALALVAAPTLFGWGAAAHRAISELAQEHLNKRARAEIARLLGEGETLVSIATWADEVRRARRETGPWHYIDIPYDARRGDWAQYCPAEGCVVRSIYRMYELLKCGEEPQAERAEELKFLVHFLEDMHQPLHAGEHQDRGGNEVKVVFFGRPTNLHSVWDSGVFDHMRGRGLDEPVDSATLASWQSGTIDDWVWESQRLARDVVYGKLPTGSPAVLGAEYQAAAEPVVRTQIRRAAVRLAQVLNEIWPEGDEEAAVLRVRVTARVQKWHQAAETAYWRAGPGTNEPNPSR